MRCPQVGEFARPSGRRHERGPAIPHRRAPEQQRDGSERGLKFWQYSEFPQSDADAGLRTEHRVQCTAQDCRQNHGCSQQGSHVLCIAFHGFHDLHQAFMSKKCDLIFCCASYASAKASAPAGKRSRLETSFAAFNTVSATSVSLVTAVTLAYPAKTLWANVS